MNLLTFFLPKAPKVLVYMLQQFEYKSGKFIGWSIGVPNLATVQRRQQLDMTARARLLLAAGYFLWIGTVSASFVLFILESKVLSIAALVLLPAVVSIGLGVFNYLLGTFVVKPKEQREIQRAKVKLAQAKTTKIAILGSYGKTTTKEILAAVLAGGDKKIAATPGNKNVPISQARWVNSSLTGDEDILIFEYGESAPGDILDLASLSSPDMAVITGVAAAHMEGYGSLNAIAEDLASIFSVVDEKNVYVNADSAELLSRVNKGILYTSEGLAGWTAKLKKHGLDGLEFEMKKGKDSLMLHSPIIGEHLLGTLALAVAIADRLGLSDKQISKGVAATKPFEHRMQPYSLGGATIIDDTYNGNLEGMKAGLRLLASLDAKRKVYVTPGLVEQGDLNEKVHIELGQAIAQAKPSKVVLMHNSTTDFIKIGLGRGKYSGEVLVEDNPLGFYTNLEHFVASGDVVLMQNDWPDAYN